MVVTFGSYPKVTAGFEFQRTMAESLAKERMAAQVNEQVTRIIESQSSLSAQSRFDSSERRDAISARHFSSEHLPGVKTVRSVSNPKTGWLFVAVGIHPTMLVFISTLMASSRERPMQLPTARDSIK